MNSRGFLIDRDASREHAVTGGCSGVWTVHVLHAGVGPLDCCDLIF